LSQPTEESLSASTETSEKFLERRLGSRKIAWGVNWDVKRSLGASTETSEKIEKFEYNWLG